MGCLNPGDENTVNMKPPVKDLFIFMCACLCLQEFMGIVAVAARGMEFQAALSCPMGVLRTEPRSFA